MKKSPRGISTVQESSFCRASDGASSSTSERPLALKIALDDLIWDDSDGVDDVAKDFLEKGRADCRRQKPCLILHSPERTLRAPQPSTRNVSFVPFLTVFRYPLIRVSLGGSQRSTSRLHDVFSRELNVSVSFEERQEKEDLREGWNVTLISSVPGSLFGPCHKQWLRVQNLQNICIAADVDNIPINSKLTSPISLVSVGLGLPPLTASFSCPANTGEESIEVMYCSPTCPNLDTCHHASQMDDHDLISWLSLTTQTLKDTQGLLHTETITAQLKGSVERTSIDSSSSIL